MRAEEAKRAAKGEGAPGAGEPLAEAREAQALDMAERLAEGDAGWVQELTAEELGELFQVGFGLWADQRAAVGLPSEHWELSDKSARRLGRWLKKSIAIHGLAWVEKWLPDLLLAGFIVYEIQTRRRRDALYAAEAKRAALATRPSA